MKRLLALIIIIGVAAIASGQGSAPSSPHVMKKSANGDTLKYIDGNDTFFVVRISAVAWEIKGDSSTDTLYVGGEGLTLTDSISGDSAEFDHIVASVNFKLGSNALITSLTGTGLSISGGVLNASGGGRFVDYEDSTGIVWINDSTGDTTFIIRDSAAFTILDPGENTTIRLGIPGHAQIDTFFLLKGWIGVDADSSEGDSLLVTDRTVRVIVSDTGDILRAEMDDTANIRYDSAMTHLNGMAYDKPAIIIIDSAAAIHAKIDRLSDGGDLHFRLNDVESIMDCTPDAEVILTAGADANNPQVNYLYATNSGGVATLNVSTTLPTGMFAWIGKVVIPDVTTFASTGAFLFQRYTEAFSEDRGTEANSREKLRAIGAEYIAGSGINPATSIVTSSGLDTLNLETVAGQVYQLHRQDWPARADGPYFYGNGLDIYEQLNTDSALGSALRTQDNTSLSGKRYNLIVWGAINFDTGSCKIFVNLPNESYTNTPNALEDNKNTADYSVPAEMKSVAFMIARVVIRHQTGSGGTFTNLGTFSLLGTPAGVRTGGVTFVESSEFADNLFRLFDETDPTKLAAFQVDAITTGNTRTYILPDTNNDTIATYGSVRDSLTNYLRTDGTFLVDSSLGFTTGLSAPGHQEGLMFYDDNNKAMAYYNNDADVTNQIGQEGWTRVRNVSGATILNGRAVYSTGGAATLPTVDLAKADAAATSNCIGLATHDIENNSNGFVTTWGEVRDINVNLTNFADGDTLFLSADTAGAWSTTKPAMVIPLGYVNNAHATQGVILVDRHHNLIDTITVFGLDPYVRSRAGDTATALRTEHFWGEIDAAIDTLFYISPTGDTTLFIIDDNDTTIVLPGENAKLRLGRAGHTQIDSGFSLKYWMGNEADSATVDSGLATKGYSDKHHNEQILNFHTIGGQVDGPGDSVELSLGGNVSGVAYVARDSSIADAGPVETDSIYFMFTMPSWAEEVDTIIIVIQGSATADSAEVTEIEMFGPDKSSSSVVADSSYFSDVTARNTATAARFAYSVNNTQIEAGDPFTILMVTTLGTKAVGTIYIYDVYAKVSD